MRQHEIEHDHVGCLDGNCLKRIRARRRAFGREPGFIEISPDQVGDVRVVLDDQDAFWNRLQPAHSTGDVHG